MSFDAARSTIGSTPTTRRAMAGFGDLMRMVNRSDGVVQTVLVNGRVAFERGAVVPELGRATGFGTFLPGGALVPA